MEEGIARCALFAGMRAEEVEGLLGRLACTRRQYEKGEVLLHAGYENRSIGVVLYGEIEAMKLAADGTQFLTARMGPGGCLVMCWQARAVRKALSPWRPQAAPGRCGCRFPRWWAAGRQRLLQNYIALISDKYFSLDRRVELLFAPRRAGKAFYYLKTEAAPSPGGGRRTPFTARGARQLPRLRALGLCREIGRLRREGLLRTQGRVFFLEGI